MTLQEILKSQGLNDEQIGTVIDAMKQNSIYTAKEENLDIRYKKLQEQHDTLTAQYGESQQLIEQLKTGTQDNEALQNRIATYEQQIATLTQQLNDQRIDSAMDRKLTAAGARPEDLDYLKFQWRKKGDITLDDNGEIKGGDDALAGLKTQHPVQFVSATDQREVQPHQLTDRKQDEGGMTRAEFLRKPYAERAAFANENPEAYNTIMNQN